jgi:hypothetical protein
VRFLEHLDTYHRGLVSARSPLAWAVLLVVGLGWVECAVAQDTQDPEVLAAVAGSETRSDVSLMTLQAFYYYTVNAKWSVGASPMAQFDWNAASGNGVTFPIGLGLNYTSFWGKLPVRTGLEVQYAVINPNDIPGSRWVLRLSIIPVIPAPWGDLAKALKGESS